MIAFSVDVEVRVRLVIREVGVLTARDAEREAARRLGAGERPSVTPDLLDWSLTKVVPGSGREASVRERLVAEEIAP